MIRTISIGGYILIQGLLEYVAPNGNMVVRVGGKTYEGKPISR